MSLSLIAEKRRNINSDSNNKITLYRHMGCGPCGGIYIDKTIKKYVFTNPLGGYPGLYYHDIDYNDNKLPLTGWYFFDDPTNVINITTQISTGDWVVLNGKINSDNFGKINFSTNNFQQIPLDLEVEKSINYNQYTGKTYPQIDKIFSGPSSFAETGFHLGLLKTDGTLLLSGLNNYINYAKDFISEFILTGSQYYDAKYTRHPVFQTGRFYPNGNLESSTYLDWGLMYLDQEETNLGYGWRLVVDNGATAVLKSTNLTSWQSNNNQFNGDANNVIGSNIKKYLDDISGQVKDLQFGLDHAILLKKDGTIKFWGDIYSANQINFSFSTGIKQIAANGNMSVLLTSGGTAYYYGNNNYGNQDQITTGVKYISLPSSSHSVYIFEDGTYKERGRSATQSANSLFSNSQSIRDIVYSERYIEGAGHANNATFIRDNYNQVYLKSGVDYGILTGIKITGFQNLPVTPFQIKKLATTEIKYSNYYEIQQKEVYGINQYDLLAKYNSGSMTFDGLTLNNLNDSSFKDVKDGYGITGKLLSFGWADTDNDNWEYFQENYFGSSNFDDESIPSIATTDYGKYQYSGSPFYPTGFNIVKGKNAGGIITAISPRWGIGNQHAPASIGSSIDFDGTTVTVETGFNINPNNQNCDLRIYRLSSDLPSGKYYPLPNSNKNITGAWSIVGDAQDKELPALVLAEVVCGLGSTLSKKYVLTAKLKSEYLVGGDSSNPTFIFSKDGKPILASSHWYIAGCQYCQGSEPSLTPFLSISSQCVGGANLKHPDIQALISGKIAEYNDIMFETL